MMKEMVGRQVIRVVLGHVTLQPITMNDILPAVEKALSDTWGGTVRLSLPGILENRTHVARLNVVEAPSGMPKTAILKRWRSEGDAGFDPESFVSNLFNDWAGLEFAVHIFGDEPLSPQVYAGDKEQGFFVIEDLPEGDTLDKILQGNDITQAEQAFRRYGETLGRLHAQTLGQSEAFLSLRRQLGPLSPRKSDGHLPFLQRSLKTLEDLDFKVTPTAYSDLQQAARLLSPDDGLSAFHHGDPIPSNCWLDSQGGFYLFDFESASFDHPLLEAVTLRMTFPTCGMAFVNQVPEVICRQAESAYRAVLAKSCPQVVDERVYGPAVTAACALWALAFCQGWLERAIVSDDPRMNRVRQCAFVRFEAFVLTAREFQSLSALGETFAELVAELRSRWPLESHDLPLYPAFQEDDLR